jgi:hypothetical protein
MGQNGGYARVRPSDANSWAGLGAVRTSLAYSVLTCKASVSNFLAKWMA